MLDNHNVCLLLLDGWGYSNNWAGNAIKAAQPKNFNYLVNNYFNTILNTYDKNNAAGEKSFDSGFCHTQISAGRFLPAFEKEVADIISSQALANNQTINNAFFEASKNDVAVHIISPVDETGKSVEIIRNFLQVAKKYQNKAVFLHLLLVSNEKIAPITAKIEEVGNLISEIGNAVIASITGGKFIEDGDDFSLIKASYDAIASGRGQPLLDISQFIAKHQNSDLPAREIPPSVIYEDRAAVGTLSDFDSVIFGFVSGKQIKQFFSLFINDVRIRTIEKKYNLKLLTLTDYFILPNSKNEVIIHLPHVEPNIASVLSANGIPIIKISLDSKADDIGYYFDGRNKSGYPGEKIVSLTAELDSVADDYEMSAGHIVNLIVSEMKKQKTSFILSNLPNADYFAHSKNMANTSMAVSAIDRHLRHLSDTAIETNSTLIISADHGIAENMGSSHRTQSVGVHSQSPVPIIIISGKTDRSKEGKLNFHNFLVAKNTICDIAPTILKLFNINSPAEFSGNSLI